jgi:hypothetical protein
MAFSSIPPKRSVQPQYMTFASVWRYTFVGVTVTVNVVVIALHAEITEPLELEVIIFAFGVKAEGVGLLFVPVAIVADSAREEDGEGVSLLGLLGVEGVIDFEGEIGREVEVDVGFGVGVESGLDPDDDFDDVDVLAALELEVG